MSKPAVHELSVKELARNIVEHLPVTANMDDLIYAMYAAAKFERGVKDFREGRYTTQEQMEKRFNP